MATIPTKRELGPLPQLASRPRYDQQPYEGQALSGLGQDVQRAGGQLFQLSRDEALAKAQAIGWDKDTSFEELRSRQIKASDDAILNAAPGAGGLSDGYGKNFDQDAASFMKDMPEALAQKYKGQLIGLKTQLQGRVRDFEVKERSRFEGQKTDDLVNGAITEAARDPNNPEARKAAFARAQKHVRDNPYLLPIEKQDREHGLTDQFARGVGAAIVNDPNANARLYGKGDVPIVVGDAVAKGRSGAADIANVTAPTIARFRQFQNAFGSSVPIVSGYRDPERNAKAGGADGSRHMHGDALDLDVSGLSTAERQRLIRTASDAGFTGIGVYENSIHLDMGKRRAWGSSHHADTIPAWAKEALDEHTRAGGASSASRAQSMTRSMPGNVRASLSAAAQRCGQDPNALLVIGYLESGGDPNAKSPGSSAGGILQFTDGTAAQYGLANRFDVDQSADAGARLMRDNRAALVKALGREPTVGELYLAHQQGSAGAIALLSNPDASAASVVGADAVTKNGGTTGMTAGQFASMWTSKADGVAGGGVGAGPSYSADPTPGQAYAQFAEMFPGTSPAILQQLADESALRRRQILAEGSAQAKADIAVATTNAPTAILNTGNYSGAMPTRESFDAAYGPREGADRFLAFQASVDTAKTAYDMQTMPADQIAATVAAAEPQSSGEGAALEQERYQTLAAAAKQTLSARAADPAAYVRHAFPAVDAAWQNADQPGGYQAALAATAAAQQQLGMASMKLLPDDVAERAATTFNKGTTAKGEELLADDRLAAASSIMLSTRDPAQRRAIFAQLVEAGLPEQAEGVFDALARGDTGAARRLYEAATVDVAKLPGKAPNTPAEIDERIQQDLMDAGELGDVIYGLSSGGADLTSAKRDNVLLQNAVNIRLRQGQALPDAVTTAARDLYGDLQVIDASGVVNVQVTAPSDVDGGAMLSGFERMRPLVLEAIQKQAERMKIETGSGNTGLKAGAATLQGGILGGSAENIVSQGTFRNAGNGYAFVNPYSGLAIAGEDGKPLIFTPEQVLGADAAGRKQNAAESETRRQSRATRDQTGAVGLGGYVPQPSNPDAIVAPPAASPPRATPSQTYVRPFTPSGRTEPVGSERTIPGGASATSRAAPAASETTLPARGKQGPDKPKPSQRVIDALRKNPATATAFDRNFGPGAAARYLRGGK